MLSGWLFPRRHIYLSKRRGKSHPLSCIETLHTVTLILRLPRYPGSKWKKRVVILPPASLLAASSEGNRTPQVAKLLRQKYLPGMFAVFRKSSKVFFFNSASLLVLRSVTMKDRVFGSTASTNVVTCRFFICTMRRPREMRCCKFLGRWNGTIWR